MLQHLETISASGFTPRSVREAAAAVKSRPARASAEDISFDDAKKQLDLSCSALPREAAMCAASLLYLESLLYEKNELAGVLEKMLDGKNAPELHYETNSEAVLLAELFDALLSAGARREDWPFVSASGCVANGIAWYCVKKAHEYMKVADVVTALNLEAIRGELGAFDDRLSSIARPFRGQIDCAANVRALVSGSRMTTDEGRYAFGYDTHPRVQDAICVRATPQTHGGARDVCYFAEESVEKAVFDGGSRYGVEYALDGLETAVSDMAHICERRTFRLNDSRLSYGLPMNLTHGATGLNHGFPVVQSNRCRTEAARAAERRSEGAGRVRGLLRRHEDAEGAAALREGDGDRTADGLPGHGYRKRKGPRFFLRQPAHGQYGKSAVWLRYRRRALARRATKSGWQHRPNDRSPLFADCRQKAY